MNYDYALYKFTIYLLTYLLKSISIYERRG